MEGNGIVYTLMRGMKFLNLSTCMHCIVYGILLKRVLVHTLLFLHGEILTCMSMQQWTKLNISGANPPARNYHAACCIAGPLTGQQHPLLMVVGGSVGSKIFDDVWLLDVDNTMWNEVRHSSIYYSIHYRHTPNMI